MTDVVTIKADTFRAEVILPELHRLQLPKVYGLLHLMFKYAGENEDAIRRMDHFLSQRRFVDDKQEMRWRKIQFRFEELMRRRK